MVTSKRTEVKEMSVLLVVPVFPVLAWWLSTWNGLFPVVSPCLNVRNTCCNIHACEQSQVVIVAVRACTYAYIRVSSLLAVACLLHAALLKCSLCFTEESAIVTASRLGNGDCNVVCLCVLWNEKRWFCPPQCAMWVTGSKSHRDWNRRESACSK